MNSLLKVLFIVVIVFSMFSCSDDEDKEVCTTCTVTVGYHGYNSTSNTVLCGSKKYVELQIEALEEQYNIDYPNMNVTVRCTTPK
ncbi:hypothetical protein LJC57_01310 [Parabacteroides sp. OttesenSCG-928-G07]|nr:hypothetical protein [Parabacteroides sp. OttesenSCG-928-G07]